MRRDLREQVPEQEVATAAPPMPAVSPTLTRPADPARVLALQRAGGNAAVTAMIMRNGPTAPPAAGNLIEELRALLDDDDETGAIAKMGQLSAPEAATVLGDGRMRSLAVDCFDNEEMARGVRGLRGGTLEQKLRWMFAEGTDWSLVRPLLADTSVPADEKTALYALNDLRSEFTGICDDDEMATAVSLMGGTLEQRLNWMFVEGTSFKAVQRLISDPSVPAEQKSLPADQGLRARLLRRHLQRHGDVRRRRPSRRDARAAAAVDVRGGLQLAVRPPAARRRPARPEARAVPPQRPAVGLHRGLRRRRDGRGRAADGRDARAEAQLDVRRGHQLEGDPRRDHRCPRAPGPEARVVPAGLHEAVLRRELRQRRDGRGDDPARRRVPDRAQAVAGSRGDERQRVPQRAHPAGGARDRRGRAPHACAGRSDDQGLARGAHRRRGREGEPPDRGPGGGRRRRRVGRRRPQRLRRPVAGDPRHDQRLGRRQGAGLDPQGPRQPGDDGARGVPQVGGGHDPRRAQLGPQRGDHRVLHAQGRRRADAEPRPRPLQLPVAVDRGDPARDVRGRARRRVGVLRREQRRAEGRLQGRSRRHHRRCRLARVPGGDERQELGQRDRAARRGAGRHRRQRHRRRWRHRGVGRRADGGGGPPGETETPACQ